jgi:hypothetical protein
MKKKIKELLTKKEFELVQSGATSNVRLHSADRLKAYIKLARRRRDKYRDLDHRQKVSDRFSRNERTVEKAKLFAQILDRLQRRYESVRHI